MYRFKLKFAKQTGTAIQNSKGNFVDVPGTAQQKAIPCYYSVNNKGNLIQGEDGNGIVYSFIVSMPLGYEDIPKGKLIEIYEDDQIRDRGTVKMFHRGLMDAKAWI